MSAYSDLVALARLCLRQASKARTPAAAEGLQRLAKEYEDRAAGIKEGILLPSSPQAPSHVLQQQQQPQTDSVPATPVAATGLRDDPQHGGRLVMLQIAETYEALARRAAERAVGSVTDGED